MVQVDFFLLSFLIFITFVLAVPLLSQSSFAQGPPELPIATELEFTCNLEPECTKETIESFCLPNELEGFLDFMETCREECDGQIVVTALPPPPCFEEPPVPM